MIPAVIRTRSCRGAASRGIASVLRTVSEPYPSRTTTLARTAKLHRELPGIGSVDKHINEDELSARLRLSVRTLQRWRWQGLGPRYLKLGGRVVYRLVDVEAWEEGRLRGGIDPHPAAHAE